MGLQEGIAYPEQGVPLVLCQHWSARIELQVSPSKADRNDQQFSFVWNCCKLLMSFPPRLASHLSPVKFSGSSSQLSFPLCRSCTLMQHWQQILSHTGSSRDTEDEFVQWFPNRSQGPASRVEPQNWHFVWLQITLVISKVWKPLIAPDKFTAGKTRSLTRRRTCGRPHHWPAAQTGPGWCLRRPLPCTPGYSVAHDNLQQRWVSFTP